MSTIGSMLSDIVGSLFKKPVTEMYPYEKKPVPDRLRGKISYDAEKCIGCSLCVRDCPANALELIVIDRAAKRFVMKYNIDRCIYCNQCNQVCRPKCIELTNEYWELAGLSTEPFTVLLGRESDVQQLLAKPVETVPCESC
jgi:formate hydrogenlyase subunit 6/NADH:ubiquinone oxidoreductase subunit I